MRYKQSKPLVEELMNISVLFHASPSLLRQKIAETIDKHIPDLDPACMERGCQGELTDEEAQETFAKHNCTISADLAGILARAIEAKLKE